MTLYFAPESSERLKGIPNIPSNYQLRRKKMFDDILNSQSGLPDNFSVPHDDLVRKILLRDVDSISDLIDSFKDCLGDLEDFKRDGYQIIVGHDTLFFEKTKTPA
jgi:hypothetical protein